MSPIQEILEERLHSAQARTPHFSLRSLAKKLGVSSGALSEILQGKRKVSSKLAARLAEKLNLSPAERKAIGLAGTNLPKQELRLSEDTFQLISDWWHYAILNLTLVEGFRSSPAWIAERLGLPKPKIEDAIERLLRLGLLAKDSSGKWKRTHANLNTVDNVTNYAIQRSHRVDLELIGNALDEVPVEARDVRSVTMTLHPRSMPKLKALIRQFEDDFMAEAESVKGTEVYRLCIQFIPLTQVTKGNA